MSRRKAAPNRGKRSASRRPVARAKPRRASNTKPVTGVATSEAPTPDPEVSAERLVMRVTGAAGGAETGDILNPAATIGDLIRVMFDAPNREHNEQDREAFLSDVVLSTADELDALGQLLGSDEDVNTKVLWRIVDRMCWRLRVAYWLDGKFRAAAEAEGAEGGMRS